MSKGRRGEGPIASSVKRREQMSKYGRQPDAAFCAANPPRSRIDTSATTREGTCSIRNLIGLKDIAWEAVRNASVEGDCVQATWSDEGHIGEGNRR